MSQSFPENSTAGKRVALGVSGGIAAYKAVEVLRGLQKAGCEVRVAMTKHACEFVTPLTFRALSGSHVIVDDYAADNPDPIAHINFSQEVDLLVVAPATANIIAKFANGIADDFLSSTYLASSAPVLIAPAMNTRMWSHPATRRNLERLRQDGVRLLEPDSGEMACRTVGPGRLSEPQIIVAAALDLLASSAIGPVADLAAERILVTTGATREDIDPVRFISNKSSGKMGFAIAEAALARGAEVTIISGVTSSAPPPRARIIRALSAEAMLKAVQDEIKNATAFIGAAAVADFRPLNRSPEKIKKAKAGRNLIIELEPTPDILNYVGSRRHDGLMVVGFAAETNDLVPNALAKLEGKNLDIVVANDVSLAGAGFDTETNIVTILSKTLEQPLALPLMSKLDVAHHILDEIVNLRRAVIRPSEPVRAD